MCTSKKKNEISRLDNADNVFGNIYLLLRKWNFMAKTRTIKRIEYLNILVRMFAF